MKRIMTYLLAATFLFACNSKKPKEEVTIKSADGTEKVTIDANQAANTAEDMQKMSEELQKLPVLTLDQLKALMPQTLNGAPQSNYSATSMAGASYATADYRTNDSTKVTIMFYDCAGPAGAGIFSTQYMSMMNFQQEDDNGYTKTTDYNGQRAIEHCEKRRNDCTLQYFTGGRFLVTLQGQNVDIDALKDVGKSLSFK